MTKVRRWPFLSDFKERQPIDIPVLTDEQLQTAKQADKDLHPNRKGKNG
jgi:hypothetical protein